MVWPDFQENSGLFRDLRQEIKSKLSLGPQSHFLIGISGGPDSMFLAYFFIWLRAREGCQISLAHFNHQLRPEFDEEETHGLAAFARTWDLEFYTATADVRALAAQRQAGIEEAARAARHHFFQETLVRLQREAGLDSPNPFPLLALGHNQDDLVETVLINLGRGTGLDGLSSMPYYDGKILRPLLGLSSQEIRDFLKDRGLSYYLDQSNAQDLYLRNRIRQEVLPAWRAALGYDPGPQLLKYTESLRSERQALDQTAGMALAACRLPSSNQLNLKSLISWPLGLHYRILQQFFQESLQAESFTLTDQQYKQIAKTLADLPGQASFDLGQGWVFLVQGYLGQVTLVIK